MSNVYKMRAETITRLWKERFSAFFPPGVIVTPFALVDEILDKLPVDWTNPTLTFLDPCCGSGRVLMSIKYRLLAAGHSEQHIVENMIYGMDIDQQNVDGTVAMLGGEAYNHNIKCGNSLTEKWSMKFDVVVGNPPYQYAHGSNRSIYPKFYELAFSLAPVVAFVAPTTWLTSRKAQLVDLRSKMFAAGTHSVVELNAQQTFGVAVDALGWTLSNVEKVGQPILFTRLTNQVVSIDIAQSHIGDSESDQVLTKLKTTQGAKLNVARGRHYNVGRDGTNFDGSVSFTPSSVHQFKMLNKVSVNGVPEYAFVNKRAPKSALGSMKVIFSYLTSKNHLGEIIITDEQVELSHMCVYQIVADRNAGLSLHSFLTSKLFRFALPLLRPNTTNTVGVFQDVTIPPLTQLWTDQELYAHFNLTVDEIKLIEDTVK